MITQEMLYLGFAASSIVIIAIMWRTKLLSLPKASNEGIALMSPLIGFLLFLSTAAYVPQWIEKLMMYSDTHGFTSFSHAEMSTLPQIVSLIAIVILLVGFIKVHSEEAKTLIWGSKTGGKAFFTSVSKGLLYAIMCYPIIMATVQSVHILVEAVGFPVVEEQVALIQLRALKSNPPLFWTMVAIVVTIIPILEELLFRGLLQNFFQGLVGSKLAIAAAAILFAFFHYAPEQGNANIELLIGLFLYACFMGIFYLRVGSLWVPITMHAAFNGTSIFFMMYL